MVSGVGSRCALQVLEQVGQVDIHAASLTSSLSCTTSLTDQPDWLSCLHLISFKVQNSEDKLPWPRIMSCLPAGRKVSVVMIIAALVDRTRSCIGVHRPGSVEVYSLATRGVHEEARCLTAVACRMF